MVYIERRIYLKKSQVDIVLLAETHEVVTLVVAENFSITLIPTENSSSCFFVTRRESCYVATGRELKFSLCYEQIILEVVTLLLAQNSSRYYFTTSNKLI
jgi:hypothetical protein